MIKQYSRTLEGMKEACLDKYEMRFDGKRTAMAFLERQEAREEKRLGNSFLPGWCNGDERRGQFIYFDMMVDKLLLFGYLTGKKEIIYGLKSEEKDLTEPKRILTLEDLF